ncbi:MAG: hypothetical protein IPH20_12860 [Bacteroidales bacterium]|nr:hypothetical protein [Bacteroidales bacterium]
MRSPPGPGRCCYAALAWYMTMPTAVPISSKTFGLKYFTIRCSNLPYFTGIPDFAAISLLYGGGLSNLPCFTGTEIDDFNRVGVS